MAREMTPQERAAAIVDKVKSALTPIWLGGRQRMLLEQEIAVALIATRRAALLEASKVCRSNTYMSKDALDGGAFGGPGSCEYGCGDVIANELDRLASEGG